VGGDYNDLSYDPAQGYKMAPKTLKPGSNLRRLCRVPARDAASNGSSFHNIDMATQFEWDNVDGPGMAEPIKDPVKVLLPFYQASTLDRDSQHPESPQCSP
jgi:hypothetical protein